MIHRVRRPIKIREYSETQNNYKKRIVGERLSGRRKMIALKF